MNNRYFNKYQNRGWSLKGIYLQIKKENPALPEEEALTKALLVYKELNRLNQQTNRLDEKFYRHNILAAESSYNDTANSQNEKAFDYIVHREYSSR